MFGAVPGKFSNLLAAFQTAEAYGKEEAKEWVVVSKTVEGWSEKFQPCRKSEVQLAEEKGWKLVIS